MVTGCTIGWTSGALTTRWHPWPACYIIIIFLISALCFMTGSLLYWAALNLEFMNELQHAQLQSSEDETRPSPRKHVRTSEAPLQFISS